MDYFFLFINTYTKHLLDWATEGPSDDFTKKHDLTTYISC